MDTFYQPKMRALNTDSKNQNAIKNSCGFTLIELLVAISTVAVLIALLLPVIQKKREEYARNKATENITAMMLASNVYFRRMGSYPNSISELFQFCSANPGSCSLDPQLATGRAGGYGILWRRDDGTLSIVAEPERPGITGSITVIIDVDFGLTSVATPGADAARQQAFDNILASGAATVVQLLNLDSTGDATSQVRSYTGATAVNAGILNSVFTTLDTSRDARVSIQEINAFLTSDPAGPTYVPLKSFFDTVSRELRLETLSTQELQDISVSLGDFDGDGDVDGADYLFSYDGLGKLTTLFNKENVAGINATTLAEMLAKLDAAEAAEASGNLNRNGKLLKQYRQMVKAQIGKSLTRANANILLAISNTL
jgi:prepilin-type N-terminal cleavage/methylation domain-containing protein